MQECTIKKLSCSLEANDLLKEISPAMRLSAAEWLQFDLVLVHEEIYVANSSKVLQCIWDLYKLVQEYDVENLVGDKLAEAWIHITLKYNEGGRQCSPMLLQLRWYQLKKATRRQVFKPNPALPSQITKLLHGIAIKYQKIITHGFPEWKYLIKRNRVILPEQFVAILQREEKWKHLKAHERWYLDVNDEVLKIDNVNNGKRIENITITLSTCTNDCMDVTPIDSERMDVNDDLDCNSKHENILNEESRNSLHTPEGKTKSNTTDFQFKKEDSIDPKLLMKAIVYTKKLDAMDIFKETKYHHVYDKEVAECAILESKPSFKPMSEKGMCCSQSNINTQNSTETHILQ